MQTSGQTKAPARFNEATLLSAMENPTKYMDTQNKQLADTLKSTGGLGTVATRADIIDKLFNSFLIEKRGKDIHITSSVTSSSSKRFSYTSFQPACRIVFPRAMNVSLPTFVRNVSCSYSNAGNNTAKKRFTTKS